MSEIDGLGIDHIDENPRLELADAFRAFMVKSIKLQETLEIEALETHPPTKLAGSLYKLDKGSLKTLIAEPAKDQELDDDDNTSEREISSLPSIWLSVVIPTGEIGKKTDVTELEDPEEKASELEIIVFEAEELFVKRVYSDGRVQRHLSTDEQFIPSGLLADSIEDLFSQVMPDDDTQEQQARALLHDLVRYEVRSIGVTNPQ